MNEYWRKRVLGEERMVHAIANRASAEMAKMYREQYARVVKEIKALKAEIDYGNPLTRTQLWNYARWRKVEESLRQFVTEATKIDTQIIHDALDEVFEKVIGAKAEDYGGALGMGNSVALTQFEKQKIIAGNWSGEHYSTRVWKNTAAVADKMREEITQMLVDGKGIGEINKALRKQFGVSYSNADRLARTEASYTYNSGAIDRYKDYGDDKVQIIATDDERTCDVCKELPGKPYDINNPPFLPAHPRCRCCYAPWTKREQEKWEKKQARKGEPENPATNVISFVEPKKEKEEILEKEGRAGSLAKPRRRCYNV